MRLLIEDYWRQAHLQAGYELLYTPPHRQPRPLANFRAPRLFYQENMFEQMAVEAQPYQLKPMNCPFHVLTYQHRLHSYRELPIRWAELGTVYRYERSGVLHGLMRVRGFTQDDAHIFCFTRSGDRGNFWECLNLTEQILSDFGFTDYEVNLSTRPAKSVGSDDIWELATSAPKKKKRWILKIGPMWLMTGAVAFYGPKIDIKIKDAHRSAVAVFHDSSGL